MVNFIDESFRIFFVSLFFADFTFNVYSSYDVTHHQIGSFNEERHYLDSDLQAHSRAFEVLNST